MFLISRLMARFPLPGRRGHVNSHEGRLPSLSLTTVSQSRVWEFHLTAKQIPMVHVRLLSDSLLAMEIHLVFLLESESCS